MRLIISDSFQDENTILSSRGTRSESEASLELVVAELQHRIRNLLSVVECVVTSTDAGTANDYRKAIAARIEALSDAYGLIENARERRVSLGMLLERTLAPHAAPPNDRIVLAGPDIFLAPHLALSLHLVFHELATNASKYGALSAASGSVEVCWDILATSDKRAVAIQWCERGGPRVRKPPQKGFGMRLIAKALSGSRVDMDFAPAGLVCRILLEIDPPTVLRETVVEMSG
jgi:two-component sensor histidine kinase